MLAVIPQKMREEIERRIREHLPTEITVSPAEDPQPISEETQRKAEALAQTLLNKERCDEPFPSATRTPLPEQEEMIRRAFSLTETFNLFEAHEKANRTRTWVMFERKEMKAKVIGAVIGAEVGAVAVGISTFACTQDPLLTGLGALTGGAAGGKIGWEIGKRYAITVRTRQIQQSDAFTKFRTELICKNVFPFFEAFIKDNAEICDLWCSISQDYPRNPVQLPSGEVLDKEEAIRWIRTAEETQRSWPTRIPRSEDEARRTSTQFNNLTSPQRKGDRFYTADDLVSYFEHYSKIVTRMKQIRERTLAKLHPNDIISQGLTTLYKSIVQDAKELNTACMTILDNRLETGTIQESQYTEACKTLIEFRGRLQRTHVPITEPNQLSIGQPPNPRASHTRNLTQSSIPPISDPPGHQNTNYYGLTPAPGQYDAGNCLFQAVALAKPGLAYNDLRMLASMRVFNDRDIRETIETGIQHESMLIYDETTGAFREYRYISARDYEMHMRQNRTLGTQAEIRAIARLLQQPIYVITQGNQYDDVYEGTLSGTPIFLEYIDHHYRLLIPTNPGQNVRSIASSIVRK